MDKESENIIREKIIEIIKNDKHDNVKGIIDTLKMEYNIKSDYIIEQIESLERDGIITLKNYKKRNNIGFIEFSTSIRATWYWVMMICSIVTYLIVILIPKESQLVYYRYFFSFIYVFILPGYAFTRMLYSNKEINITFRIILSIGISIGITYLISLLLNETLFGISLLPIITSLFIVIFVFSTIGLYIEHLNSIQENE